jgi:rhamnosyltransferase
LKPGVSVVIRTYNEDKHVGRLIMNLRQQSEYGEMLDIVVVDSGSTDRTKDIVKGHGLRLVEIAKDEFNYSKALNLGISESTKELIVLLSAHAMPCSPGWIAKIAGHFEKKDVAGVYCKQNPWPGADLQESVRLSKTFGAIPGEFDSTGDLMEMHFSNAASCIRRNVWQKHQFAVLPAAEDKEWADWAVSQGYRIVYDSAIAVYHSHTESPRRAARRVIELEKSADINGARRRTALLTARQSIGLLVRDIREILGTQAGGKEKLSCLKRSAGKCFWYAVDFNRMKAVVSDE